MAPGNTGIGAMVSALRMNTGEPLVLRAILILPVITMQPSSGVKRRWPAVVLADAEGSVPCMGIKSTSSRADFLGGELAQALPLADCHGA